ncbi:MAG: AIR synthase family protein [Bacillota bacterium]|jgi:hydrogenase expression/formation protein HypE|nr:AIR synthase [Candidatus Fermentithermobacillaceae bacterium]HAF66542.1 AIR synthase [Clostridiales bacterium UBA9857]HOA71254.1 AIR synthase family protein [Bacillota bacterium]HPZ86246.1 AIR synthase family protein [Bacillota bacterium]HQD86223.1 AIR synthase family protein [Bacillota bacterium]
MKNNESLTVGKVPPELLEQIVFSRLGYPRKEVVLRPAIGEDTAALDLADELLLASTDPITGAEDKAGWLAVKVAINDIAATGGEPVCILVTLLLPETALLSDLEQIINDINDACVEEGVQVAGGHTEVTPGLRQPIISVTALGKTRNRRVLSSSNAQVGDDIVVTKWAGMEGTSILVRDFPEVFEGVLDEVALEQAKDLFSMISVTLDGKIAAEAGANACHDATEGGVLGAIYELCQASGLGAVIYADKIPVLPVTLKVAEFCRIDPLRLISSGCLVVTAPDGEELCEAYRKAGVNATVVGKIVPEGREVVQSGQRFALSSPGPDHLWLARRYLESITQGR